MKQYNVKCPICGTMNKGLYLEETHGWMECEKCHQITLSGEAYKEHVFQVPVVTMDGFLEIVKKEAEGIGKTG